MKFLKIIVFINLLFVSSLFAADPEDLPVDTIALEEIEISANKLVNFSTGAKIQNITPGVKNNYNSANLSELFAQITPVSVTSYGMAGLSNVSLRGMGTKHTAVLWNGINLQSSMNGGVDMNSIPAIIIDEINIQFGGSGALFGSGAVGGIIHLNTNLKFENDFEINYTENLASFSNYFEGLKVNYSNTKFASSTRIYHKYGKNDFNFINTQQFGKPEVKQENAATTQYGILQSNAFKINNKQKILTNIWAQHHYLEIPAMITASKAEANQNTDIIRVSAMWNRNGEISSWYSRFYYNYESLVYKDPLLDSLVSKMDNYAIVGEIENKLSIGDHFLLNLGLNNTFQEVLTKNYGTNKNRNQTAFFTSLKYFNFQNTFATVLSYREELVDSKLNPFTLSLSTRYYINKYLNINSSISKTYNIPTLNDLYWVPGGNPDLKSENGWSEDLGINLNQTFTKSSLDFNVTAFNINLNNQVIWVDWSAENVEKLWSRGIETNLQYNQQIENWKIGFFTRYTYTKSTCEESENTEVSSIGKQLLYVPENKGNIGLSVSNKWLRLSYIHNYVGRRYVTKDNSKSIDPYMLGDLAISSHFNFNKSDIHIQFKVNNIWNETYEVMAFYAMPLRYYSISLSYNFIKPNH